MGKLGKKARKFAKKNLQSVLKRRRKIKSMIKRKASKREERDHNKEEESDKIDQSKDRNIEDHDILDIPLDDIFSKEGSDEEEDDSDSDGYLSEESDTFAKSDENGSYQEDNSGITAYSVQNKDIYSELVKKKNRSEKLKKKDPEFSRFLESYKKSLDQFRDDESYSDDETNNDAISQVEHNIDFVRKKRDEVAFSPKDEQAIETFLQLERSKGNTSFKQYYCSTIEKAVSHGLLMNRKSSSSGKRGQSRKRQQLENCTGVSVINGGGECEEDGNTRKKRKT